MVYSSIPLYHLDHQANWQHQQASNEEHHQQMLLQAHHEENRCSSAPSPPTCNEQVSGGGGEQSMTGSIKPNSMVDRARQAQLPLPEAGLKCPRCESTNTKFCYFNNYNLSQPRHFCKTCRRYWTRGGSLRNVPVGGATRRTAKRSKATRPATITVTSSGGSRILGNINTNSSNNTNNNSNNSLFLSHNLPFLPSLHHYGYSNPNPNPNPNGHIGLNLLGHGGGGGSSEMEFPNLLASFEGLGRINNNINGMHHFDNSNSSIGNLIGHSLQSNKPSLDMNGEVIDDQISCSMSKIEDHHRAINLAKEFALAQSHQNHYNWNNASNNVVWSSGGGGGGGGDLSGFASPSNVSHLLG